MCVCHTLLLRDLNFNLLQISAAGTRPTIQTRANEAMNCGWMRAGTPVLAAAVELIN